METVLKRKASILYCSSKNLAENFLDMRMWIFQITSIKKPKFELVKAGEEN